MKRELLECLENISQLSTNAKNEKYFGPIRIELNSIEFWYKKALKILDKIEFEKDNE